MPKIEPEKIIDTSSAGDAFVGGFLAQFIKNEPIEKCIDCGIWASGLIIQRSGIILSKNKKICKKILNKFIIQKGCTFPNTMDYV